MWTATDTRVDRLHFLLIDLFGYSLSPPQNITSNNEMINIKRIGKNVEGQSRDLI